MQWLTLLISLVVSICIAEKTVGEVNVVIVGGGIAGLSAARKLMDHPSGNYKVTVVEGRRDRYGGRICTDRTKLKGARGAEADLGAMFLNSKVPDNPLRKMLKSAELEVKKIGPTQIQHGDQVYKGEDVKQIFSEVSRLFQEVVKEAKASGTDRSMRTSMEKKLSGYKSDGDNSVVAALIRSHSSMLVPDFSTMYFDPETEFGYDSPVLDGFETVNDLLLAGVGGMDPPIPLELHKVVRQIYVDADKKQVLVRTKDRKQLKADKVVVALPLGVMKDKDMVVFDPPIPSEWRKAVHRIGIGKSNKVILVFKEVFWPKDIGVFKITARRERDRGFLETWINMFEVNNAPYLMGVAHGDAAQRLEEMKESEIKSKSLEILSKIFGKEVLSQKIQKVARSQWLKPKLSQGASSYPKAGINASAWEAIEKPVCPYIYFAGEYTIFEGMNSAHGAYFSGIRAAEQIISGTCDKETKKESTDKSQPTDSQKHQKQDSQKQDSQKQDSKKKDEL